MYQHQQLGFPTVEANFLRLIDDFISSGIQLNSHYPNLLGSLHGIYTILCRYNLFALPTHLNFEGPHQVKAYALCFTASINVCSRKPSINAIKRWIQGKSIVATVNVFPPPIPLLIQIHAQLDSLRSNETSKTEPSTTKMLHNLEFTLEFMNYSPLPPCTSSFTGNFNNFLLFVCVRFPFLIFN